MNRFTAAILSVFRTRRTSSRPVRRERASGHARLSVENLNDRCLPSASPLASAATPEASFGPALVAPQSAPLSLAEMAAPSAGAGLERKH